MCRCMQWRGMESSHKVLLISRGFTQSRRFHITVHIFATKLLNVHGYRNIVFQTILCRLKDDILFNLVHTSAAQDVRGGDDRGAFIIL